MKYLTFLFGLCVMYSNASKAQVRYVDEVFLDEEITIHENVFYSTNISLRYDTTVQMIISFPEDLYMDVYLPDPNIDSVRNRPVVVVPHSELIARYNVTCFGAKEDLATQTLAKRLARMGYVAVAPQLRMGWNPLEPDQHAFTVSFTNAIIRQVIDIRNCTRYLRYQAAEEENPYGIDTEKFVLWGSNRSGNTTLFAAFYNTEDEFLTPPYFYENESWGGYIPSYFGNTLGTEKGYDIFLDSLISNLPSPHAEYSSRFQLAVFNGGITYDTSFISPDDPPGIFFIASNNRETTQFETNGYVVILPVPRYPFSSYTNLVFTSKRINQLGITNAWNNIEFSNPIANQRLIYPPDPSLGPMEGLYGFEGHPQNEFPWAYWDTTECYQINPQLIEDIDSLFFGTYADNGIAILDTMIQYVAPRACITLGLDCEGIMTSTSTTNRELPFPEIKIYPNPTKGKFNLAVNIQEDFKVELFSSSGILLKQYPTPRRSEVLDLSGYPPGMYFIRLQSKNWNAIERIIHLE